MAHVLIGFAEALPAPEVLFSLRRAGHEVSVFARGEGLPLERLSPEQVFVIPSPEEDAESAVAALRQVMGAPGAPDIILPLDDTGLWLTRAALPGDPRNAGADGHPGEVALDKEAQIAAAKAAGLAVPETRIIRAPVDFDSVTTFPAIAKPALAVREAGGRLDKGGPTYLLGPQDVERLKSTLTSPDMAPLLVQPLIQGTGEGVFGLAGEQGVTAWSGHRRLRMMNPHGSGSSACVSLMPDQALRDRVEAFIRHIGWRGPFMVELLRDAEGTAWFMELNGRMWGSLALARRQGLEYPAWAIAAHLDPGFRPAPVAPPARPLVLRNMGRELLHLLFVLRGPKSAFHRAGWPSFWKSAAGVFAPARPAAFYNHDPAHRGYVLRDAAWTLRKALRR